MHRLIQDHLEKVLIESNSGGERNLAAQRHLESCQECREHVAAMREQSALIRESFSFSSPEEMEPRPGFYARVLERIEAQGPISIWHLFVESAFGRRIAVASMALAVLLGVYLVSSERNADQPVVADQQIQQFIPSQIVPGQTVPGQIALGEDQPGVVIRQRDGSPVEPSKDAVLVNLVTYQEQ